MKKGYYSSQTDEKSREKGAKKNPRKKSSNNPRKRDFVYEITIRGDIDRSMKIVSYRGMGIDELIESIDRTWGSGERGGWSIP